MTDKEQAVAGQRSVPAPAIDVGRQLRRAREAKGLALADAAKELRIDARFLTAIEQDDYAAFSGPVFIKGYVRSYARYLGLDPEPLVHAFDHSGLDTAPPIVPVGRASGGRSPLDTIPWSRIITTAFVVGGVLLAGWLVRSLYDMFEAASVSSESATAETGLPAELSVLPLPPPEAEGETAQLLPLPDPSTFSGVPDAPVSADAANEVSEPPPVDVPPAEPVEARAPGTLVLEFEQDSWVEVYDAGERRLLGRVGKAGRMETLTGTPPLSIVLGYAPGVKVTYNGAPVDVKAHRRGQVARFTLGAEAE